jgi:peptide-methionine (S)-S-oxide reductase
MSLFFKSPKMPTPERALPGRAKALVINPVHFVLKSRMTPPFPEGFEPALFAMGCFWGAEKMFWQAEGVYTTVVGYAAGFTPNPTYQEVCSGLTGHTEVVQVVFDPQATTYEKMLKIFWENHDPTQGMRQGGDIGTQYRSGVYTYTPRQQELAEASRTRYQERLASAGYGQITTEIQEAGEFYFAEDYHQQYLAKNPGGYCGTGGTGVGCPGPFAG